MTKIDIISGFLGAGKTTLIKKLLNDSLKGQKIVLIENEFGEIGIDGGFLKDAGIEIKEMNSGCICCSLVGDFGESLKEVLSKYQPDRVLIEPSGVGKLSDVKTAIEGVKEASVLLNSSVVVVDAKKCKLYLKNFGEFFINQIEHAGTIILSRTDTLAEDKIAKCIQLIRQHNEKATIITTPWTELTGQTILEAIENQDNLEQELLEEVEELHHHKDGCSCGEHHHGHQEESCNCGNHHHHADEVFTSFGMETPLKYSKSELEIILEKLDDDKEYGMVLRAKGMLGSENNSWLYFDYVPGELSVREGKADYTGKICVIGSNLQKEKLKELFDK